MSVAEKTEQKKSGGIGDLLSVLVQALVLAMIIRTVLFQPFSIPSGSMRPTLLVGDYLFVTKWAYGYSSRSLPFSPDLGSWKIFASQPERGDVAVFKFPPNPKVDYIKRVIGLPGDRIQMKAGQLFINGEGVKREKTGVLSDPDIIGERPVLMAPAHQDEVVDVYRETLPNGISYDTIDWGLSMGDNTREFVVPAGHYFMMGDNRDNSSDSRFGVGYVPDDFLVGRANIIFFSIAGGNSPLEIWTWPSEVRGSRILDVVR